MNYWWINANPNTWEVYMTPEAEMNTYTPTKLFNVTGTEWLSDYWSKANHSEAEQGDIVICYKTGDIQKIVAIGRIIHVHRNDADRVLGCYIEVINRISTPEYSKAKLGTILPELGINNQSFPPATMYKLTQTQGLILLGLLNQPE